MIAFSNGIDAQRTSPSLAKNFMYRLWKSVSYCGSRSVRVAISVRHWMAEERKAGTGTKLSRRVWIRLVWKMKPRGIHVRKRCAGRQKERDVLVSAEGKMTGGKRSQALLT